MWEVPKATSPIEAVTTSMYVMPVASSLFTLVINNVVMAGPTKRLGGVSSWGTLMVTQWGWPLVKDQATSPKPGSGTFSGSSIEGSGIGVSHDEVELDFPHPMLLCSSIWWCLVLLLLELWLWWHCLKLPKFEATYPTGVTRWDEYTCVQLGSSHDGDSFAFLSVSCWVGEVACPLVSSVVGSPEVVARTSDSSANGNACFSGLHYAQSSGPFLQDSQP